MDGFLHFFLLLFFPCFSLGRGGEKVVSVVYVEDSDVGRVSWIRGIEFSPSAVILNVVELLSKNCGGRKKTHSVLEDTPFQPICTSRPNRAR